MVNANGRYITSALVSGTGMTIPTYPPEKEKTGKIDENGQKS